MNPEFSEDPFIGLNIALEELNHPHTIVSNLNHLQTLADGFHLSRSDSTDSFTESENESQPPHQPSPVSDDPFLPLTVALEDLNQPETVVNSLNHIQAVLDAFHREHKPSSSSSSSTTTPSTSPAPTTQTSSLDRFRELDEALERLNIQNQAGGRPVPSPPPAALQPPASPSPVVVNRERFNNVEIRQVLQFPAPSGVPDYGEFYGGVMGAAQELCDRIFTHARPQDLIQMELRGQHFSKSVSRLVQLDGDDTGLATFQNLLDELVQSNMSLMTDQDLELVVQLVRNPRGGGKRRLDSMIDHEVVQKKRKFLYVINNPDNSLCFAICLAHLLHPSVTDREAEVKGREIQNRVGLGEHREVSFSDVSSFERVLGCKIVVFYRNKDSRTLAKFHTSTPAKDKTLFLFLHQNHYYGIKNVKSFLGTPYVCQFCYAGYTSVCSHRCRDHCSVCLDPACCRVKFAPVVCADCGRTCRSAYCVSKHKEPREEGRRANSEPHAPSQCDLYKQCRKCFRVWYAGLRGDCKPHVCPKLRCKICKATVSEEEEGGEAKHLCYIRPLKPETDHNQNIVFYDFETYADERGVHVPFLVYAKTLSGVTWSSWGPSCPADFVTHFRTPAYRQAVFIAHNARGFDSYLILNAMIGLGIKPSLIMQGSKVICFTEPDYGQRFIDSLCFLAMPLAAMPKALGFEDKVKGYFPHAFSSEAVLNYVGPYPPPQAYCAERMTPEGRRKFEAWYEKVRHGVFNFKREAVFYCQNDVDILARACSVFRNGFIEETGVDPFSRSTIASACMKVFVTRFLPPDTLAIPPPDHYRRQVKSFSHSSIQWLQWVADTEGIYIRHALNEGEKRLGSYYVDWYTEAGDQKYVWEFLGCFYHGCPSCFQPQDLCPLTHTTFEELYARTLRRLETLRAEHGVTKVTVMWEHRWNEMKKSNNSVTDFLRCYDPPEPLIPRDALYGGRTCAVRLRHRAAQDETVRYVDVTSLYPYVNCSYPYPLGHPQIIHRDFAADPRSYFGLIRAVVYPPRGLYFPLLPYRTPTGKLVFTLCRTCADLNAQTGPCRHDDEARALSGVWVTPEFNKALELGYRVAKITEVWHFDRSDDSIFLKYMQTFLKGKQEASGYPPEAVDQET